MTAPHCTMCAQPVPGSLASFADKGNVYCSQACHEKWREATARKARKLRVGDRIRWTRFPPKHCWSYLQGNVFTVTDFTAHGNVNLDDKKGTWHRSWLADHADHEDGTRIDPSGVDLAPPPLAEEVRRDEHAYPRPHAWTCAEHGTDLNAGPCFACSAAHSIRQIEALRKKYEFPDIEEYDRQLSEAGTSPAPKPDPDLERPRLVNCTDYDGLRKMFGNSYPCEKCGATRSASHQHTCAPKPDLYPRKCGDCDARLEDDPKLGWVCVPCRDRASDAEYAANHHRADYEQSRFHPEGPEPERISSLSPGAIRGPIGGRR